MLTCDRPPRTLESMAPLRIWACILAVAWDMRSDACFKVESLSLRPGSAWLSFRARARSCLLEGLCGSAVATAPASAPVRSSRTF